MEINENDATSSGEIKSGLKPACKECANAENKIYEAEHTEERQQYREENRATRNITARQYYASNKDDIAQDNKEIYQLNKKEICAARKLYVEANKEDVYCRNNAYRKEHREEHTEYNKAYAKTERGSMVSRAARHRRKALKKTTPGTLTAQEIQTKLKAQKYKCYYCHDKFKKQGSKYVFELEHTVPLSRTEENPRHDVNFVVLSCSTCNSKKRAKLPHEWPEGGRLF